MIRPLHESKAINDERCCFFKKLSYHLWASTAMGPQVGQHLTSPFSALSKANTKMKICKNVFSAFYTFEGEGIESVIYISKFAICRRGF